MTRIEGTNYYADIEWHEDGKPVLYVTGHGKVTPKEAIEVIRSVVETVNNGYFEHVCCGYNMLDAQIPFLGRFINAGAVPSTQRTAHLVVATTSQTLRLFASLMAVSANRRLRTLDVVNSVEEMHIAINRWLSMPDRTRSYTIDDV